MAHTTTYNKSKAELLSLLLEFIDDKRIDIETGIEDGIYDDDDNNAETLANLKRFEQQIEEFKNMKPVFIVAQVLGFGSLQPVFTEDDLLMVFNSETEAEQAIQECLDDVMEAVEKGDMLEAYEREDYEILPATLMGSKITCIQDGDTYEMDRSEDDWKKVQI